MLIALPEEGIREHHVIHAGTRWIIENILVNEKQQRHVYFFSSQEFLFLKAEAFYFGEIWCYLPIDVSENPAHMSESDRALTRSGVTL